MRVMVELSRRGWIVTTLVLSLCLLDAGTVRAQTDRLTGVWEGMLDRGDRHQPIALVFRPQGESATGLWYLDGAESGVLDEVHLDGNTLTFTSLDISFRGSLAGERLSLTGTVKHGSAFPFVVRRTSTDPTRLPSSVRPASSVGLGMPEPHDVAPDSVYRAHAVPAGEASSTHASLRKGTLLLVGGGAGQEDINARFIALAGGAAASRIVYIPTAAALPGASARRRAENTARNLGVEKVVLLDTASRREADSKAFVKPLQEATGVWIDGGEEDVLIDTYMGTRTEKELIAVLERGAVVGGTSAGAMIWGSKLVVVRPGTRLKLYERPRVEDLSIGDVRDAAIGLLRNVLILPHFTEFRMEKILTAIVSASPGLLGLGVDEATALEVHGDVFQVLGRGEVHVLDGRPRAGAAHLSLKSGARYDVRKRKALL